MLTHKLLDLHSPVPRQWPLKRHHLPQRGINAVVELLLDTSKLDDNIYLDIIIFYTDLKVLGHLLAVSVSFSKRFAYCP